MVIDTYYSRYEQLRKESVRLYDQASVNQSLATRAYEEGNIEQSDRLAWLATEMQEIAIKKRIKATELLLLDSQTRHATL